MSPTKLVNLLSLAGILMMSSACDKGPKSGEPSPAAKVGEAPTATPDTKPETPDTKADKKVYGAGVSEMELVSISDLVADPEAFEGKTVQVEGLITDVCAKRGCWFEMAGKAPGEKARFKVQDGEMVFPMSAKGQTATAQGKIVTEKLSLEETREMEEHYASESGREFDPASITEGRTVFRIEGTGAEIR